MCACEDFTDNDNILYEFENLALSTNPEKKIETDLNDIMDVLDENKNSMDIIEIKQKFWRIFIIDAIIGNTNIHNGDWGFLLNKKNNIIKFSPIYDCGSCLNPLYEDEQIKC